MRKNPTKKIEQYRIRTGPMASDPSYGANGAFQIPYKGRVPFLRVIASDASAWEEGGLAGTPWEHVSVSLATRTPTWEEMDFIKRIFWRDDETVFQLHVPRDRHVNNVSTCLHLWKPVGVEIPLPPTETVGNL